MRAKNSKLQKIFLIAFLILTRSNLIQTTQQQQENAKNNNNVDYEDSFNESTLRDQCLKIDRSVCLGPEKQEIGLKATEQNLVGYWNFDDKFSIDHSKTKNDFLAAPKVGPQQGGNGQSAYFDSTYMSTIKHNEEYNKSEFTISFWMFLIQNDFGNGWKTILQKGDMAQDLTPTIQLWPNESKIHVKVSTDFDWNENLDSKSSILLKRWTHLSFTFSNMLVQIYINGILDNQLILTGQLKKNQGNFHIGKDPWHQGPIMYFDDLRIYDKILKQYEIYGISSYFSSMQMGKSYAVLGCESCSYQKALVSCPENYHLCTFQEIYAGGYHIARIMGWFRASPYFWVKLTDEEINTQQIYKQELFDPNVYKLGICCQNNIFY